MSSNRLSAVEKFAILTNGKKNNRDDSFSNAESFGENLKRCELLKPTWVTYSSSTGKVEDCQVGMMY